VIVTDSWSAVRTRPGPGEEDTPQMKASRANAALAAPGLLRQQVKVAAGRRGTRYAQAPAGLAGVHHGCGGELPAGERAQGVIVVCRKCGRRVDQDLNTVRAMAAVTLAEKPEISDGKSGNARGGAAISHSMRPLAKNSHYDRRNSRGEAEGLRRAIGTFICPIAGGNARGEARNLRPGPVKRWKRSRRSNPSPACAYNRR